MKRNMIDENGWYKDAKHVPSPFFDKRASKKDISLLVIHNISLPPREYGGSYIEQLFMGKLNPKEHPFFESIYKLKVSAHCLIKRGGDVVQFVSFYDRAWHAGESSFAKREKCNDYSIGIELEGDDATAYTEEQYRSLISLSRSIMIRYPEITPLRITGHQYIAPLRKTDPGLSFDWPRFRSELTGT